MVKFKTIAFILIGIVLISCKKNNPETTISSELDAFSEIELNNNFDVYLIEDSVFFIEIKGYLKTISKVTYSIESGVLKIDNEMKYKFTRPKTNKVSLYIHSKPLSKVTANETCYIRTITPITSTKFGLIFKSKSNFAELELNGENFYYWNNYPCGGKLTLSGSIEELSLWNTALMSVDAKNLLTQYALVENSAKGICEVNVSNKLEYSISGDGNIELYGNPPTQNLIAKTGNGKLIIH